MTFFIKAAEVWLPDISGNHLVLGSAFYGDLPDGEPLQAFQSASESVQFAVDEGLPGRTWAERRPLIWTDLGIPHFKRKEIAEIAGLACGISIPVYAGEFLMGVVVVFCAVADEAAGVLEIWHNRDADDNELRLTDGYYGKFEKFEFISRRLTIMRGRGLPGQAWSQRAPTIMTDLGATNSFLRSTNAAQCGISTGLAIPFCFTKRNVQVVTVLSTESTPAARRFEIWRPDEARRYLLFSEGYCSEGSDLETRYRGAAYDRGEGNLGQVWLYGRPLVKPSKENDGGGVVYIPFVAEGLLNAVVCLVF